MLDRFTDGIDVEDIAGSAALSRRRLDCGSGVPALLRDPSERRRITEAEVVLP
jgi:hypothetical protein